MQVYINITQAAFAFACWFVRHTFNAMMLNFCIYSSISLGRAIADSQLCRSPLTKRVVRLAMGLFAVCKDEPILLLYAPIFFLAILFQPVMLIILLQVWPLCIYVVNHANVAEP